MTRSVHEAFICNWTLPTATPAICTVYASPSAIIRHRPKWLVVGPGSASFNTECLPFVTGMVPGKKNDLPDMKRVVGNLSIDCLN